MNYGSCQERRSKKMYGKQHSEETKQKIRETLKEKPKSEEFKKKKRKPILQYTKDGKFIREWNSATTASKEVKIHQQNICHCCKGRTKSSGGFIWKYKE